MAAVMVVEGASCLIAVVTMVATAGAETGFGREGRIGVNCGVAWEMAAIVG